jgi:hypothetical protein
LSHAFRQTKVSVYLTLISNLMNLLISEILSPLSRKSYSSLVVLLSFLLGSGSGLAASVFLSPDSLSSSGGYDTSSIGNMIDGSGLTVFDETGTHSWFGQDEWLGSGTSGTLRFDFESPQILLGFYLWNQEVYRGAVKDFSLTLRGATDEVLFTSAPLMAEVGLPSGATPVQFFAFQTTAGVRSLEMKIDSVHSAPGHAITVIAEVGVAVIPEPTTSLLLASGSLILVWMFRRRFV